MLLRCLASPPTDDRSLPLAPACPPNLPAALPFGQPAPSPPLMVASMGRVPIGRGPVVSLLECWRLLPWPQRHRALRGTELSAAVLPASSAARTSMRGKFSLFVGRAHTTPTHISIMHEMTHLAPLPPPNSHLLYLHFRFDLCMLGTHALSIFHNYFIQLPVATFCSRL